VTFFRYIAVQLLAYGLDMAAFLALTSAVKFEALISNVFSKIIAGVFAFIAHRVFTFQSAAEHDVSKQAVSYFLLLLVNLPLSSVIFYLLSKIIVHIVWAKFLSDVIGVFLTYWISKTLVFSRRT
jgi:putative flippase GtrA